MVFISLLGETIPREGTKFNAKPQCGVDIYEAIADLHYQRKGTSAHVYYENNQILSTNPVI